jgi:hypothetical protein
VVKCTERGNPPQSERQESRWCGQHNSPLYLLSNKGSKVSRGTLSCGISKLPRACERRGDVGMTPVVCSGMHFASNAKYPSECSRPIKAQIDSR